uniref:Putative F-box/kelch-repeat protein n=1 Tax=Noccaea caerulescens TaxID=107243 RepID=A0A1J3J094_NOCCA
MASRSYSRGTILDCRSHTLSEAPCLRVGLRLFSASVVDGKIYVAGSGLKNPYQVLDTKAQVAQLRDRFLIFPKDGIY